MKKYLVLFLTLALSVTAFSASPGKSGKAMEDLIKQGKAAHAQREINRTTAIESMKATIKEIVAARSEKLRSLGEDTIAALGDKTMVMTEATAELYLNLLSKSENIDASIIRDLIKMVENDNDAQAVLLVHNLRGAVKKSAQAFSSEVRTAVRSGETLEKAITDGLMKYGTEQVKKDLAERKLTYEEILKRCKAMLGLA